MPSSRLRRAPLTLSLMGACLLVTATELLWPSLLEGTEVREPRTLPGLLVSPWLHGLSRASAIPHLAGNLVLLGYTGSRLEFHLGRRRLGTLTALALLAFALLQVVIHFEVNGASVFLWAYAPPLFFLYRGRKRRRIGHEDLESAPGILFLMWVAIPLGMTWVPFALGWSGSALYAFLVANAFHLCATIVGFACALVWRDVPAT